MIASMRPARRATRVPPIAAVREGATIPPGRFAKYRPVGSGALAVLGFVLLILGLFVAHGTGPVLLFMGVGAVLVFFGVALFSAQLSARSQLCSAFPATGSPAHPGSSPGRTRPETRSAPAPTRAR